MNLYSTQTTNSLQTTVFKSASIVLALLFILSPLDSAFAQEPESISVSPATPLIEVSQTEIAKPIQQEPDVLTPEPVVEESLIEPVSKSELSKEQQSQVRALDQRLKKGEINQEEYDQQMALISGPEMAESSAMRSMESTDPAAQTLGKYVSPEVSTTDGSLTYEYPIIVPPGRNGMTPNLKLVYSSANKFQGSIFGTGWSLNIPYIQRMNKKGVSNLYTEPYFLSSLDGELVDQGNGVFVPRTEGGNFLKYEFSNNIWTVTDKQGTIYSFGATAQARQDDSASSTRIFSWMLEGTEDTNGNTISYNYFKNEGQIYPDTITYNQDDEFEIIFGRTNDSSNQVFYNAGFGVTTNYNISDITVKQGSETMAVYDIQIANNLLEQIEVIGYEGGQSTSLPPTEFEYAENNGSGWNMAAYDTTSYSPSSSFNFDNSRHVDVNGDGLVDIVVAQKDSNSINNYTLINTGAGFTQYTSSRSSNWIYTNGDNENEYAIPAILDIFLQEDGDQNPNFSFTDINGDGLVDLVTRTNGTGGTKFRYHLNNGSGWNLAHYNTTNYAPSPSYNFQNSRHIDVNGDGLTDIVYVTKGDTNDDIYSQTALNTGNGFVNYTSENHANGNHTNGDNENQYAIPSQLNIYLEDNGWGGDGSNNFDFTDINGDGLVDLVTRTNGTGGTKFRYHLNNGSGWNMAHYDVANYSPSTAYNFENSRHIDVDSDGLDDIVYATKGDSDADVYNQTLINTGSGFITYTSENHTNGNHTNGDNENQYAVPSQLHIYLRSTGCCDGPGPVLDFVDINGDGLIDILNGDGNQMQYHLNNAEAERNTLTSITLPEGGRYNFSHSSVQTEDVSNSTAPYTVPVVTSVVKIDTNNQSDTTQYEYNGASHYFANSFDKKFAGFSQVTKISPDGTKVVSKYHQANGEDGNELTDSYAKIGRIYEETTTDDADSLYARKRFDYVETSIGTGATSTQLSSVLSQLYDGTSSHTDTATSYEYDSYGNKTKATQFGQVVGSTDGTFTDSGNDKRVVESTYTENTADYIVGLPTNQTLKNDSGTKVAETSYLYDADGNLLEEGAWIDTTNYATTTYTYNSYGLITSALDPLSNTTTYTYDAYNLYPTTISNELNQDTTYTYDYSSGKPKTITDPNGKLTEYSYDGLDRLVEEKRTQGNGSAETMRTIAYNTTADPQYKTVTLYRSGSDTQTIRSYIDGFGREIQTKAEYEDGWATIDTTYDEMGRVESVSLPYGTLTNGNSSVTSNVDLLSVNTYDPLGRILTTTNARGVTSMDYDGFTTTVTDAENNDKSYVVDAFDNLSEVQENNGASVYTTTYVYDAQNNLTQITDAEGNERGITYDGLGRRIELEDLHNAADTTFGVWSFVYDGVNLVSTTDPEGDETVYTYDDLNRVLTENNDSAAGTEITYTYDNCTNGIGYVCSIVTDGAATAYTYFKQGLADTESVTIDSTTSTKSTTYNRQGQPVSVTQPNATVVTYVYNTEGLPSEVKIGGNTEAAATYGVHGQLTTLEHANGFVTENIYDDNNLYSLLEKTTGIATTSIITDVTYSTTTTPGDTVSVFSDDFQSGQSKWVESNEYDWQIENENLVDVPGSSALNKVMHADNCDSYCVITTVSSMDLSDAASADLSFWRWVQVTLDSGEYLKVEVYNGTSWVQIAYWTHGAGDDTTWHYESYDLTPYLNSDFKVRFVAKMSDVGERVEIDDVSIVKTLLDEVSVSPTTSTSTEYSFTQQIQNLTYSYDAVGNITSLIDASDTDTAKTQAFTYDDLYRLTGVTTTNTASGTTPYTQTFAYSPIGNITNFDGTTLSYVDNGYNNPHAVTSVGGVTHSYSNNGNLTNDGVWAHTWDYRNRLVGSSDGVSSASYTYNHSNERAKLVEGADTTLYPFGDYQIENGTPKLYLSLGDMTVASVEGATTTHIHTDHLGGTTLTTNSSGEITKTLDYLPYGETRIETGTNEESVQFTGYDKDSTTGLNYSSARYYNPTRGVFISQDPVALALGDWDTVKEKTGDQLDFYLRNPQTHNAYSYAFNNPLKYTDKGGEFAIVAAAPLLPSVGTMLQATALAIIGTVGTAMVVNEVDKGTISVANQSEAQNQTILPEPLNPDDAIETVDSSSYVPTPPVHDPDKLQPPRNNLPNWQKGVYFILGSGYLAHELREMYKEQEEANAKLETNQSESSQQKQDDDKEQD